MSIPFFAGVGSRETPDDVIDDMYHAAYYMGCLGWGLSSGGARGADNAFQLGMTASPNCNPGRQLRIYLIGRHWELYRPNPAQGLLLSTDFTDTWEEATEIAKQARGSFEGLGPDGMLLHTRNAFQVLHHTLKKPVRQVICWAKPVGKKGRVEGGTNTAVQVALTREIPVMNLYLDDQRERLQQFIVRMRERFDDQLALG